MFIYHKLSSLCNNIGNGVLVFWNRYWWIISVCEWWKTKHQAIIVCSVSQSVSQSVSDIHLYFNLSINRSRSDHCLLQMLSKLSTRVGRVPDPGWLDKIVGEYNSLPSDICIIHSFIFSMQCRQQPRSALTLNIGILNKEFYWE